MIKSTFFRENITNTHLCTIGIKLNGKLFEIQSRRGQTISKQDLRRLLMVAFHYKPEEAEIEKIIFEVDETMDGQINWEEFQLAYLRNVNDKTGLEPYNLHNIITFCMYHAEGLISVAEALDCLKRERNYTDKQANKAIESVLGTYHDLAKKAGHTNIENEENDDQPTPEDIEAAKQRFKELQVSFKKYKQMASKRYNTRNVLAPKVSGGRMEMVQKKESKELDLPYLRKKGKGLAAVSSIYEICETEDEPSRKTHQR